ncbi:BnaA05g16480D [Brassica napus]|uniref:Phosphoribulokinase, chloroplastic n=1 Tax=Brassica napus TaxID=3708 RepID=A0A078HFG0_BRANA|nr:BnaA05g16480D [Brassica napus]
MAVSTIYSTQALNSTHFFTSSSSKQVFFYRRQTNRRFNTIITCAAQQTVVIGLAADSGCGKSTFMRRLTSVFGGAAEPPKGGNPDSNTLISDMTTVICLDDYHSLDRTGRKEKGVTALDPRANDFDLMYEQVKALKSSIAVEKPIYNHVTGLLDAPELIQPPKILVIEGLHPMFDERVRDLLDFSIYLDISNEVKFAWKIQVCFFIYFIFVHWLILQNEFRFFLALGLSILFSLFQVSVVEMDGQFDRLDELIYVESHLSNLSTKFYGEVTQQMLKHADFPGSNNGTGLFQTIVGLKIRDLYEQLIANKATAPAEAAKA